MSLELSQIDGEKLPISIKFLQYDAVEHQILLNLVSKSVLYTDFEKNIKNWIVL